MTPEEFSVVRMTERNVDSFSNRHSPMAAAQLNSGSNAVKRIKVSCRKSRNNQARLRLFALAYKVGNFLPGAACELVGQ
jgi:hypothetical protein